MSPLSSIFPAARVALFEEELLVWINTVVHEGRELVFYFVELVVWHRLWHRCELAPRRPQSKAGGVAQESHLSQFLRPQLVAGEALDVRACPDDL